MSHSHQNSSSAPNGNSSSTAQQVESKDKYTSIPVKTGTKRKNGLDPIGNLSKGSANKYNLISSKSSKERTEAAAEEPSKKLFFTKLVKSERDLENAVLAEFLSRICHLINPEFPKSKLLPRIQQENSKIRVIGSKLSKGLSKKLNESKNPNDYNHIISSYNFQHFLENIDVYGVKASQTDGLLNSILLNILFENADNKVRNYICILPEEGSFTIAPIDLDYSLQQQKFDDIRRSDMEEEALSVTITKDGTQRKDGTIRGSLKRMLTSPQSLVETISDFGTSINTYYYPNRKLPAWYKEKAVATNIVRFKLNREFANDPEMQNQPEKYKIIECFKKMLNEVEKNIQTAYDKTLEDINDPKRELNDDVEIAKKSLNNSKRKLEENIKKFREMIQEIIQEEFPELAEQVTQKRSVEQTDDPEEPSLRKKFCPSNSSINSSSAVPPQEGDEDNRPKYTETYAKRKNSEDKEDKGPSKRGRSPS